MIDAHIPANLHYFLVNYLSLIRLYSEKIDDSVETWQKERGVENYALVNDDDAAYSSLLNMCGYKHAFSRNMILVIFIAIALILIVTFIYICRLVMTRR